MIIIRSFGGTKKYAYAIKQHVWQAFVSVAEKKSIKLDKFDDCGFGYLRIGRQLNWDMSIIEVDVSYR